MVSQYSSEPLLLVLNPGSSSTKWALYRTVEVAGAVAMGTEQVSKQNDAVMTALLADFLTKHNIRAVIVRVVHGGSYFFEPLLINDANFHALKTCTTLAPLHNVIALDLIERLRNFPFSVSVIAVFDTQFFHDLPEVAQTYGLPLELQQKYRIRRYGFHGFAHQAMVNQWETLNPDMNHYTIITAQLGSGCSMAAIRDGKPIDTTMGFTPNEGLLMRTRCGDIDPGLLTWLQRNEGWTPEATDEVLNQQSGWMGLSGGTENMADVFASDLSMIGPYITEQAHKHLAFNLFCYRFRKTMGAYFAILGGLDGILLSGGIAENNLAICQHLLSGSSHLGIELNRPADSETFSLPLSPYALSAQKSPVECWVVPTDETSAMVHAVLSHFSSVDFSSSDIFPSQDNIQSSITE